MAIYGRPQPGEYAPYYGQYIEKIKTDDILAYLKEQGLEIMYFLRGLSEKQGAIRYAEGKWSVKELVGHLIDAERLFAFRALWFARNDPSPQPGMDQDVWVAASNNGERSRMELWKEHHVTRTNHLYLFRSFDDAAIARTGQADGKDMTVRAIPWVIAGHEKHHLEVLRDNYGIDWLSGRAHEGEAHG